MAGPNQPDEANSAEPIQLMAESTVQIRFKERSTLKLRVGSIYARQSEDKVLADTRDCPTETPLSRLGRVMTEEFRLSYRNNTYLLTDTRQSQTDKATCWTAATIHRSVATVPSRQAERQCLVPRHIPCRTGGAGQKRAPGGGGITEGEGASVPVYLGFISLSTLTIVTCTLTI